MLANGSEVHVLVNPDAPPHTRQWQEGIIDGFRIDEERGEELVMVVLSGDLLPTAFSRDQVTDRKAAAGS